ncbi:hypothetical protein N7471_010332 [Penicillium samsonianum]|uniref:uncharacterized protein n=1 Tax=Penicillium samsonianum TaxID=1882272 RepID=UPI002546BF03|nr:uncharacterized protein N7471_010332 [Penicillium samsonianum]KAJ6125839.1 hypothetical protein N7471_010332 [Penicillium samsonianum]
MDYLVHEEQANNDTDFCPIPKTSHEDVQNDTQKLPKSLLAQKEAQREAQRKAQRKFRRNQNDKIQQEQKKIAKQSREIEENRGRLEAQSRELEKEQKTRQGLEQQVQQLKAENMQLKLSAEKWEQNSTVLQGSVKDLQRSLGLLWGESGVICRNGNQSSAGSTTLSPSTSQSGTETHVAPRNFSLLSNFPRKEAQLRPMISPISPMFEHQVTNKPHFAYRAIRRY